MARVRHTRPWDVGCLLQLSQRWVNFMPTITQWNITTRALTERTLALLYHPDDGRQGFSLRGFVVYSLCSATLRSGLPILCRDGASETTFITMTPELTFFAWHRMLRMCLLFLFRILVYISCKEAIGDPNKITDASIFFAAMSGIDTLVELYLHAGEASTDATPPDGNTILHIFGHWLFHAVKNHRSGYV